jgi:hypothetical protein
MNRIEKDIELAKSHILKIIKLAKRKGLSAQEYVIKYGEKADNLRPAYLSVEDIIKSKETNALYTINWTNHEFVVKILGPYEQWEVVDYGWKYENYYGIHNVVLVKWDGKWSVSPSTITNGWSPSGRVGSNQAYKIYPHNADIFINWQTNPLNS